jgi:hypothetical protein
MTDSLKMRLLILIRFRYLCNQNKKFQTLHITRTRQLQSIQWWQCRGEHEASTLDMMDILLCYYDATWLGQVTQPELLSNLNPDPPDPLMPHASPQIETRLVMSLVFISLTIEYNNTRPHDPPCPSSPSSQGFIFPAIHTLFC